MVAFLASTPFQIMNAINIRKTVYKNQKADIIVFDHKKDKIVSLLEKSSVFDNVYFTFPHSRVAGSDIIRFTGTNADSPISEMYSQTMGALDLSAKSYEHLITFSVNMEAFSIYHSAHNINKLTRLFYAEDGLAIYTTWPEEYSQYGLAPLNNTLLTDFYKCESLTGLFELYSYNPELIMSEQRFNVHRLNKVAIGSELMHEINDLFEFDAEKNHHFKERDFIFFDQPYDEMEIVQNNRNVLSNIYACIDALPSDNTAVRIHPRSNDKQYKKRKFFVPPPNAFPWELYQGNYEYLMDKIYVGLGTTALCNAKLMFDKEPIVISAQEAILANTSRKIGNLNGIKFMRALKKSYRQPERFMTPVNRREYTECIAAAKKMLDEDRKNGRSQC